jgi:hypothetical protein
MTDYEYQNAYRTLAYAIKRGEDLPELRRLLTQTVADLRAKYEGHRHAVGDRVLRRVDSRPATVTGVHESDVDPGNDTIVLSYDDGGPDTAGSHSSAVPAPSKVPDDFPVKVLGPDDGATDLKTCGGCGRSWDDAVSTTYTPAPAARCPFEYYH